MVIKLIGIILTVVGCGSVGFKIAANYRREEKALRQLLRILEFMECELQFRFTTLPNLCKQIGKQFNDTPGYVFMALANELEAQVSPDVSCCFMTVLNKDKHIPPLTKDVLRHLGMSIGKFDLSGQVKSLSSISDECKRHLRVLNENKDTRLRSYQTLGLCAGAALAILLV